MATAQVSASRHPTSRATGFSGGSSCLAVRHVMTARRRTSPGQSAASGLVPYHADAGIRSYGAGTSLRYEWSAAWTTLGYVEYTHLAHTPAESPLIDTRGTPELFTFGLGAKYSFYANW